MSLTFMTDELRASNRWLTEEAAQLPNMMRRLP